MERDIRETSLYREAEALYRVILRPGSGAIVDAVDVATNGTHAAFAGTLVDQLAGTPPTRICLTSLATGETRLLTFGPNTDRSPKFSPDGRTIAFLSDRHRAGDFQLHLVDPASGITRAAPRVDGWVEYLDWSPDGRRILLGVAGHGADVAGGQGALTSSRAATEVPAWIPSVEERGEDQFRWRRTWVYELNADRVRQVGADHDNVWEAAWCGDESLVAITSPGPGEGLWYSARLQRLDLTTGRSQELYTPVDQIGLPAGSPSGAHVAVVEAVCSDRWIVAGEVRLIDATSGAVRRIDTRGVDVTYIEWRSDNRLLFAGHRGFETVIGTCDLSSGACADVWSSHERSTAGRFATVAGLSDGGDCVLLGERFDRAPEVAVVRDGAYRAVRSFGDPDAERATPIADVERVNWTAPDGLVIQGWLLRPAAPAPHPLVMYIHGGPVTNWHPNWLGRRGAPLLMLLRRGYAIFLPNPRGSSGRGQDFARRVVGDMGGADTHDYLSGIDQLVDSGLADPHRLGVTGASYGGFMTSWLVTQDARFAAAVSVAPVTNYVTEHLISNIPHFASMFLADTYRNAGGKYFQRSPVMHAHQVRTPVLNVCGALDRCTPPEEAHQFHSALLESGVESALVRYPEEGHGVRRLPAAIDYAARVVDWFERHMPAAAHADRSLAVSETR